MADVTELNVTTGERSTRNYTQAEKDAIVAMQPSLEKMLVRLRNDRNARLAETDWMAFKDVTLPAAWKTYRQELRDITIGLDTVEKVNAVTWPTKPL